jgi:hypothetical protein
MSKLYNVYNILAGIVLLFLLFDKFSGKILKLVDKEFQRLLTPKEDKAQTREEVLHILKKQPKGEVA